MKNLLNIIELSRSDINDIFSIANAIHDGKYKDFLHGKSIILFFPDTSIRTRVTFEKGIYLLGGQSILFPTHSLDKKEEIKDVVGYLNNWADAIVVRYPDINVIKEMASYSRVPIINAMTSVNHPCEIISDMFALLQMRKDFVQDKFLFCGRAGNIGNSWKNASRVMGFELSQCCPEGYEMDGLPIFHDIREAVKGKDIILTDSIPPDIMEHFAEYQITKEIMENANEGAILDPCPPFYRGEEVSEDVINSHFFVGYQFKKNLLEAQQAIIIFALLDNL